MQAVIVIPARLASTRLPRKLLLTETGKSVLEHTYRAAAGAQLAQHVLVAADDQELVEAVRGFGGQVVLTSPDHLSGTDRVAEVAAGLDAEIVVNVQGDEPEIDPRQIDRVIQAMMDHPEIAMATLAVPITRLEDLQDPACVKVVCDQNQRALYFSRSVIPHPRSWDHSWLDSEAGLFWQHVGLYAYRRKFLLQMANWPPSPLEQVESLEQLRVLHHGHVIHVVQAEGHTRGIDTPEDYAAFVSRHRS